MSLLRPLTVLLLLTVACGGATSTSTSGPSATSTTTTTTGETTTTAAVAVTMAMPAPLPLQMSTFEGVPAPDSGFTMTLLIGSPLKAAIGATLGFPLKGCLGITLFDQNMGSPYFDGYVPTTSGGCENMEGVVDDDAVVVRTDHSIVVNLFGLPPMPFFPAFQVMREDGGGWYSLRTEQPIDPADVTAGYFTHLGGDLFTLPDWNPVTPPESIGGTCAPDATCLGDGRFEVTVDWVSDTDSGQGVQIKGSDDDVAFSFFDPDRLEVIVKVLNGCSFNDRFWVFAAGLTDVEYTVTITDTRGTPAARYTATGFGNQPIQDTSAFATCP